MENGGRARPDAERGSERIAEKVYPLVRHYPTNLQIVDVEDLYPTGGFCYHFKRENVFWPRKSSIFWQIQISFSIKKNILKT